MSEDTMIGLDLAKRVFHLHGARADGSVAFRKKLSRAQLLTFLSGQPHCLVAMEACATAHGWGREIAKKSKRVRSPETVRLHGIIHSRPTDDDSTLLH